jgi:hypothetical protein
MRELLSRHRINLFGTRAPQHWISGGPNVDEGKHVWLKCLIEWRVACIGKRISRIMSCPMFLPADMAMPNHGLQNDDLLHRGKIRGIGNVV